MEATLDNRNKYTAMLLTLVIHALLFLLFLFIVFITPIPPFEIKPVPEIEIGLGMVGLGNQNAGGSGPSKEAATTTEKVKTAKSINTAANIVTDETETAVSMKRNPKSKNDTKVEAPAVAEEKPSQELLNALAIMKSKKEHKGKGKGEDGKGGNGTGPKNGIGSGPGTGHGNKMPGGDGTGYDLTGRSLIAKPDRMTDAEEEGIVVVEIIVDENGKVIKATPGQRGSNTTSAKLYSKARMAAFQARFNPSPDGTKEQRGTYKFVFTLE